jgi:hypothetical protein
VKKKKVTCKELYEHICENLDENLDSPQCKEIKAHFEDCPDCIQYLESLKTTIKLYRFYPAPRLSSGAAKIIEKGVVAGK